MNIASGLIRWIFILINLLLALFLLFSAYSSNVDPQDAVLPAFFGLAFPFILLGNFLFLFLWLLVRKKLALISLLAIIFSYKALNNFFQFNLPPGASENSISLMSYNVRLFDLYNWSENKQTRDKIFDQLSGQNADIYCFQEFYHTDIKGAFETRDTLVTFLSATNYREAYTHELRGEQYFGVATFSRYPIVNTGVIRFENDDNNICLFTDHQIGDDIVRVYNLHIASIRFSYDDYKFVESIDKQSEEEFEKGARTIYSRLADAFIKRSEQSKKILEHIETSPYPVIVAGDFNDSPNSYCYQLFSSKLTDSFKEAGLGIGKTYIGSFPSFRIDYIFHSNELEAKEYRTLNEEFSDHHAIISKMEFK